MYKIYIFMQCAPDHYEFFESIFGLRADVPIGPERSDWYSPYRPPIMAGVIDSSRESVLETGDDVDRILILDLLQQLYGSSSSSAGASVSTD